MDSFLYTAFLLTSIGFIVIPGPNVLVIVSTSINQGVKRGLQTVAGTTTAMALQLLIAGLASASVVQLVQHGLSWLKWVGLLYLCYLALQHWRRAWRNKEQSGSIASETAVWTFSRGFLVSISNPKTILFFTAFLPQFTSAEFNYSIQITVLSLTFVVAALLFDSLYAILAGRLRHLLWRPRLQHGISGSLYGLAALGLYLHSRLRA